MFGKMGKLFAVAMAIVVARGECGSSTALAVGPRENLDWSQADVVLQSVMKNKIGQHYMQQILLAFHIQLIKNLN